MDVGDVIKTGLDNGKQVETVPLKGKQAAVEQNTVPGQGLHYFRNTQALDWEDCCWKSYSKK